MAWGPPVSVKSLPRLVGILKLARSGAGRAAGFGGGLGSSGVGTRPEGDGNGECACKKERCLKQSVLLLVPEWLRVQE
jgi:hypothetical protein